MGYRPLKNVSRMKYIRMLKMNEDVGIRMRGPVVLQRQNLAVEIELVLLEKSLLRQCASRGGIKVQVVGGNILGRR
jgi:hypothetical protein